MTKTINGKAGGNVGVEESNGRRKKGEKHSHMVKNNEGWIGFNSIEFFSQCGSTSPLSVQATSSSSMMALRQLNIYKEKGTVSIHILQYILLLGQKVVYFCFSSQFYCFVFFVSSNFIL
jgi:hypothetical protein